MNNKNHIITLCFAVAILLAGCGVLYDFKPIKQFDQKEYDKMITFVIDRDFKINPIVSEYEQFDAYRTCIQDSLLPSNLFKSSISKKIRFSPITLIARQRADSPT